MSAEQVIQSLQSKGLFSAEEASRLASHLRSRPFSLFYELRLLLYLGILLLSTGLGTLVYQHLDSIGHQIIVVFIGLATIGTFAYAFVHRKPFSWDEVRASKLEDFSLLASALLFLILEGYVQYQYKLFGEHYDLATLLPALIFLPAAYFFDHRGVLSMGITALASWLGIKIAPVSVWWTDNISSVHLILISIAYSLVLVAIGVFSDKTHHKKHFAFIYLILGLNLALTATLWGLFNYDKEVIYFVGVISLSVFSVWYARQNKEYQFLLMAVIYSYIAITYCLSFIPLPSGLSTWFIALYFITSGIGVIIFLLNLKRIMQEALDA